MIRNAVLCSIAAGACMYVYFFWLASDRGEMKVPRCALKESIGLLVFATAFSGLLLFPWAVFEGWTFHAVALADLPYRKMRTAVYAVYAALTAGLLGVLHSAVIALFTTQRQADDC